MQTDADILIVEDSATQALRLQFYLQERGYVVATVPDGVQALHYLAGQRPRLVVCDVLMPHMDGYELCRRIRADEALRQVPVLMWTRLKTQPPAWRPAPSRWSRNPWATKPCTRPYSVCSAAPIRRPERPPTAMC
jgi:CheY-like chemotaxis protein